jgi:ribonuclease HI
MSSDASVGFAHLPRPAHVPRPTHVIYTDGGCSGNPGPGAWAYVLSGPGGKRTASGFEPATTNNRMELVAVIRALEDAARDSPAEGLVAVHTDSQYVKKGITEWIGAWQRAGWTNSAGQPVKNRELWESLLDLSRKVKPTWTWVRGHAGDALNEECDGLVRFEIRKAGRAG